MLGGGGGGVGTKYSVDVDELVVGVRRASDRSRPGGGRNRRETGNERDYLDN